jgi:hypothetical protein
MYSFNQETSGAESKAWEANRNIKKKKEKKRCERIKRVSYYYILGPQGNNIQRKTDPARQLFTRLSQGLALRSIE